MSPTCDDCGAELVDPRDKNASGWWRDRCLPCITEDAYQPDERTSVEELLEGSDDD